MKQFLLTDEEIDFLDDALFESKFYDFIFQTNNTVYDREFHRNRPLRHCIENILDILCEYYSDEPTYKTIVNKRHNFIEENKIKLSRYTSKCDWFLEIISRDKK